MPKSIPPHPTGAPGAKPDFLFYRKSRFDIIVALRGDTPPSAGVVIGLLVYCAIVALRWDTPPTAGLVIGLLVYCAIVALRGDTPPTAGTPNITPPHTPQCEMYMLPKS